MLRHVGVGAREQQPQRATCAMLVHTFCPLITHSSPSRTARVARAATSEPAPGSLNIWHQISSHVNAGTEEPHLLLLGAERDERGAGHPDAHHVHQQVRWSAGSQQPLVDDVLETGGRDRARPSPPGSGSRQPEVELRAPELARRSGV